MERYFRVLWNNSCSTDPCSDSDRLSSETPIHCIYELERIGLIKNDDADLLRKLIRFRNIVVYEYGSIDVRHVMNIIDSQGYKKAYVIIKDLHKKLEESKLLDP
ncbi:MAG: DUF86 domain-containing protein [Desulfurococcales archaeon]|nr:DUF86 domain-containing protein [Desulfurococcales archaeon]